MDSGDSSPSDDETDQIDYHLKLYGKKAEEFKYSNEVCQLCNTRIDERGWCGCGTAGGG